MAEPSLLPPPLYATPAHSSRAWVLEILSSPQAPLVLTPAAAAAGETHLSFPIQSGHRGVRWDQGPELQRGATDWGQDGSAAPWQSDLGQVA